MRTNDPSLVIADSSALVSLISQTDANHARAEALSHELGLRHATISTPADVFTETINIIGKKLGHDLAVATADLMIRSGLFLIVESLQSHDAAMQKYRRLPASVSFTDCIVMAMADQCGTPLIFGFDKIFATCGYALPETAMDDAA